MITRHTNESHPAWQVQGIERLTGKPVNLWVRGNHLTKAELKDHIEAHYPNLQFVDAYPSNEPVVEPGKFLRPVPREWFSHREVDRLLRIKRSDDGIITPPPRKVINYGRHTSSPAEWSRRLGQLRSELRQLRAGINSVR